MEIPAHTLEEIKCDICQDYLSCSPVFSKNNGFTLCGRCFASEEKQDSANRNLKYEAVARLLKFPCKYKAHGCKETVPFAENYQEKVHEQICEYKRYECPVVEACDWLGQRKNILEHCQSAHPDHVMMNPCHLMHDIKQFCVKTYILHCFEVLFLLYTKVCIATGKIYHAVKLLDEPDKSLQFKYLLDIKRDELIFSRPGKVTIGTEENSLIVTSISMLLEFLNGFSGTIFTVRLQKVAEDSLTPLPKTTEAVNDVTGNEAEELATPSVPSVTIEELREAIKDLATGKPSKKPLEKHVKEYAQLVQVSTSLTTINEIIQAVKEIKLENDAKQLVRPLFSPSAVEGRSCRNKDRGCNFRDTDVKCQKHEEFFCRLRTWCWTCWTPVEDDWHAHYLATHAQYTHDDDTFFQIQKTGITGRTVFVKTRIGYVICRYFLNNSSFKIYIWSNLNKNFDKYQILLQLDTDCTNSEDYEELEPDSVLSETWDWYEKLDADDCDFWDPKDFEMSLKIVKV